MIQSVTITNESNESLTIKLTESEPESGLIIMSITGIGATKADINTTAMAITDGSVYNSSRGTERNIVMTLLFTYADSIEETRHRAYQYFPTKKKVSIRFDTDERSSVISGYVESNEPEIFNKKESAQISIICPDPYFYSLSDNDTVFSGIEAMFEFAFENDSLTEPLLEFGEVMRNRERNIYYDGDADIGVTITIHATGDVGDFTIYNVGTREYMRFSVEKLRAITGRGFGNGDDIIINTKRGEKSVQLLRAGVYRNVLNCLDRDSKWLQLKKGNNVVAFQATKGEEFMELYISNKVLYMGV